MASEPIPDTEPRSEGTKRVALVIHWGGRVYEFATVEEARQAGFQVEGRQ